MVENGDIVSGESELSLIFNSYFKRITDNLAISEIPEIKVENPDSVSSAVDRYAQHPSILAIKSEIGDISPFEFHEISEDDMIKEINQSSKTRCL